MKKIIMISTILLTLALLTGCANSYQPSGVCPNYHPASTETIGT